MFKKTQPAKKQSEIPSAQTTPVVKYLRPKILLIDLDADTKKTLENEGYSVAAGTFGRPYTVRKGSDYQPVIVNAALPNYTEQEILLVDLVPRDPATNPSGEKATPMEELDWWAKCNRGVIDPRPRAMAMVQDQLDRIYQNGGTFVIFADSRQRQELVFARHYEYRGLSVDRDLPYDNWSFLSTLASVDFTDDYGADITA